MARILFLCWLMILSPAGLTDAIVLSEGLPALPLGPQVEYLEDTEGVLSVEDVKAASRQGEWLQSSQEVLSFGYTNSVYWVRFSVAQPSHSHQHHLLSIAYPVLDHVDAYIYVAGELVNHFEIGDLRPYAQRPIDYPDYIIPLRTQPDKVAEVYLRVQTSSSMQIPLTLYREHTLLEQTYESAVGQAAFYGAMLVMIIYNLLIFFTIRDISYFYYVMSVVSISLLLAGIEGLTFKYLWPNASWFNDTSLVLALSGMVFFSALFFRSFLAIPQTRPVLSKILMGFVILTLFTAVGAFFLPYRTMMVATIVLAMCGILAGGWAGVVRWLDGYHAAKFFNIAWGCMLVSGFLLALNKLGITPRNWFMENVAQLGASLQAVLLSFAMAHRMTHERRMREKAQKESVLAHQQLLEHQIKANEDLDRTVRLRTEELEKANAKLKEISATDGLTNLLNRRAFEEVFENEYKRAYREKSTLAVLMIDLDHFKKINDQYGHQFGDLCLIKAAELIRNNIRRPPDIAARYGGEEFILLLPNTDLEGAVQVAENILQAFRQTCVADANVSITMSASIGAASHVPGAETHREALLREADQNLYLAKENGRDRVEWRASLQPQV